MDKSTQLLDDIYKDPADSASFGSVNKLYKKARQRSRRRISKEQVKEYLSGEDAYTLHRAVKRRFERVPIYAEHIDSIWQMDTADVKHLKRHNDGIKYLLVIVDVLSRFAFVLAMETKKASQVIQAMKKIEKDYGRRPNRVVSDPGLEFQGEFRKHLQKEGIGQLLLRKEQKAPLAERFIRTIKEKMIKFMTANDTKRYIDVLGDLVHSYNYAVHSRMKMRPADVRPEDEEKIKQTLFGKHYTPLTEKEKFRVGDLVRIVKKRKPLEKGTEKTTTDEVFIVKFVDRSHSPRILFVLEDIKGDIVKGRFYSEELVKVRQVSDPREYMRSGQKRVKTTKRQTQEFKTYTGWRRKHDIKLTK